MHRCLDISKTGAVIALVDSAATMCVYSRASGRLVRRARGVDSVAWHGEADALLCWSGGGTLNWSLGPYPPQQLKMEARSRSCSCQAFQEEGISSGV